jgi:tagatose-1,6-bisphosphate aldolase
MIASAASLLSGAGVWTQCLEHGRQMTEYWITTQSSGEKMHNKQQTTTTKPSLGKKGSHPPLQQ